MADERSSWPTVSREHDGARQKRGRRFRLAFLALLVVFTVAAVVGVFGERSRRTSATGAGYRLSVAYLQTTRPGLSSSVEFVIRRTDGRPLPETLSLETSSDYLRLFDTYAIEPEPVEIRADGDELVWTVAPARGADQVRVYLDGRIDPGAGAGRHEATTTLAVDGRRPVSVDYRTWVWP